MTTGEVELTFKTTSQDWIRARSVLDRAALRRENLPTYLVTHKAVVGAMLVVMPGVYILALVYFLGDLLARDMGEFFSTSAFLSLAVVAYSLVMLLSELKQLVAKIRATAGPSRTGREGVHWGAQRVVATSDSLSVRLSKCHPNYCWSAFSSLKMTREFVLLQIASRSGVAIPRQAFKLKADEKMFCDFFQRRVST